MIIVESKAGPFEFCFIIFSILSGITTLFSSSRLTSTTFHSIPTWAIVLLSIGLVIGGVLGLVGIIVVNKTLWGILLERVGVLFLGTLLLIYCFLILYYVGPRSTISTASTFSFSLACYWRAINIGTSLKKAKTDIEQAKKSSH